MVCWYQDHTDLIVIKTFNLNQIVIINTARQNTAGPVHYFIKSFESKIQLFGDFCIHFLGKCWVVRPRFGSQRVQTVRF